MSLKDILIAEVGMTEDLIDYLKESNKRLDDCYRAARRVMRELDTVDHWVKHTEAYHDLILAVKEIEKERTR